MELDDAICRCFDVTLRKLVNYARRERPGRASEMSRCLGAGTGCGWCIPFLKRIADNPDDPSIVGLHADEYTAQRAAYRKAKQPKNQF